MKVFKRISDWWTKRKLRKACSNLPNMYNQFVEKNRPERRPKVSKEDRDARMKYLEEEVITDVSPEEAEVAIHKPGGHVPTHEETIKNYNDVLNTSVK